MKDFSIKFGDLIVMLFLASCIVIEGGGWRKTKSLEHTIQSFMAVKRMKSQTKEITMDQEYPTDTQETTNDYFSSR